MVFDPALNKELVNYNGEKYFTPASNTKLFTFYAAYKTFKDSVAGLHYYLNADSLVIRGTADPVIFKRRLSADTVRRAFAVAMISFLAVNAFALAVLVTEGRDQGSVVFPGAPNRSRTSPSRYSAAEQASAEVSMARSFIYPASAGAGASAKKRCTSASSCVRRNGGRLRTKTWP